MKWKEVTLEEAMKAPEQVQATIHYHEDKTVWLVPILPDESASLPSSSVTGESEAIEERKFTLIEALDIWGDGCDTGGQQWSYETDMEKRDEYFKDKFGIDI